MTADTKQIPKQTQDGSRFPSNELLEAIRCLSLSRFHDCNKILLKLFRQETSWPNNIFAGLFLGINHLCGNGLPVHQAAAMAYLDPFKKYIAPLLDDPATEKDPFLVYCLGYLKLSDHSFLAEKSAAQYFQLAIDLGHADASAMLGFCYQRGIGGVTKNTSHCKVLFRQAIDEGSAMGDVNEALFHIGQRTDLQMAYYTLEIAEKRHGDIRAKTQLARRDLANCKNLDAAKRLSDGRDQGDGLSIYLLAAYYSQGYFRNIDPTLKKGMDLPPWLFEDNAQQVFDLYEEAVLCGDPRSNIALGRLVWKEGLKNLPRAKPASAYFREAADHGFAEGYYLLALCHKSGSGGAECNEALYLVYLLKAVKAGYEDALRRFKNTIGDGIDFDSRTHHDLWQAKLLYNLGKKYLFMDPPIDSTALTAFEQAVRLGRHSANYELGLCYLSLAKGTTSPQAVACLEQVTKERPEAIIKLGEYYVDKDPLQAAKWFQQGADNGDNLAQFHLARCHETGTGVEANLKEAIYWYSMAASKGNLKAIASFKQLLGFGYASYEQIMGKPQQRSVKLDSKMFRPLPTIPAAPALASAVGYPPTTAESATTLCADALFEKALKCQDKIEALSCFIRATLEGHKEAQKALLKMGDEVEKWHKVALNDADPESQFTVGEGYRSGKSGLPQTPLLAIHWYSKAADQGHELAKQALKTFPSEQVLKCYEERVKEGDPLVQYRLACCYDFGWYGIPQNPARAEFWYRQAAAQEHLHAAAAREGAKSFLPLTPLLWYENAKLSAASTEIARPMRNLSGEETSEEMLDERAIPAPIEQWREMTLLPAKKDKKEAKPQTEHEMVDLSRSSQPS